MTDKRYEVDRDGDWDEYPDDGWEPQSFLTPREEAKKSLQEARERLEAKSA